MTNKITAKGLFFILGGMLAAITNAIEFYDWTKDSKSSFEFTLHTNVSRYTAALGAFFFVAYYIVKNNNTLEKIRNDKNTYDDYYHENVNLLSDDMQANEHEVSVSFQNSEYLVYAQRIASTLIILAALFYIFSTPPILGISLGSYIFIQGTLAHYIRLGGEFIQQNIDLILDDINRGTKSKELKMEARAHKSIAKREEKIKGRDQLVAQLQADIENRDQKINFLEKRNRRLLLSSSTNQTIRSSQRVQGHWFSDIIASIFPKDDEGSGHQASRRSL